METSLETIFKIYSSEDYPHKKSSANIIFYPLHSRYYDNEEIIKNIINDLVPLNLIIDDWLLYRLAKDLKINMIEHLSKKGFDVTIVDDNGENILFKLLKQTSFNFSDENFSFFRGIFENAINLGVDYSLINFKGRNLIHQAVIFGANTLLLEYIASMNIDINKQDNDGFTPLHFASSGCTIFNLQTIKTLLGTGLLAVNM
ncbi:ankyrin repeat domain-containing protein [Hymenobacter sp. BT664]|uniref:Ankyrin repeat domain-containing protein n=1 Tax=Hymenobacter montanus TaxID=2771359 RepID=A0A927BCQ8_9BACT|nr:ankyrin repeat domain-containing protein [Hymenobacter montanus]MBD2767578.1 ankyrin repeat domain-containing protein [Hymenobacter montanus]